MLWSRGFAEGENCLQVSVICSTFNFLCLLSIECIDRFLLKMIKYFNFIVKEAKKLSTCSFHSMSFRISNLICLLAVNGSLDIAMF